MTSRLLHVTLIAALISCGGLATAGQAGGFDASSDDPSEEAGAGSNDDGGSSGCIGLPGSDGGAGDFWLHEITGSGNHKKCNYLYSTQLPHSPDEAGVAGLLGPCPSAGVVGCCGSALGYYAEGTCYYDSAEASPMACASAGETWATCSP
jgi:hypothetical protein